ncbi:putative membrane protein YcaP [Parelusimicrobium proximum]|uniref:DUF421 domain-containing protein n=1 Tax=Parelusimicrobium proximum TaxID=3228953 RepID=UPI003D17B3E9
MHILTDYHFYIHLTIKLIVSMIGILFFIRFSGRTQLSQLTPLNTVNALVLGSMIGGIIYMPELTVWHLVFALLLWTLINHIINYFSNFRLFRHLIRGQSDYLIKDGVINMNNLEKNKMSMYQLRTMLREKDIFSLLDVDDARLESDGHLSITRRKNTIESHLMIENGKINTDVLKSENKSEEWLREYLKKLNITDLNTIDYAEWTPGRGFYIIDIDGKSFRRTMRLAATDNVRKKIEEKISTQAQTKEVLEKVREIEVKAEEAKLAKENPAAPEEKPDENKNTEE